MTEPTPRTRRRPDGITVLAIWYAVLAFGGLMASCAATIPIGVLSLAGDMPTEGRFLISLLVGFGAVVALVCTAVFAVVAWGLWTLREWARILALILAILHLPFFPVGTTVGALTLWYLTSHPDGRDAFEG